MKEDLSITPVLRQSHPDLVDADGNRVKGAPKPGLFAARSTLPFHGGYFHIPDQLIEGLKQANPDLDEVEWAKAYAKQGSQRLEKAIFLVSQRDFGRDLLRDAYEKGTFINLDADTLAKERFGGSYSKEEQMVRLSHRDEPKEMALIAAHELRHSAHQAILPNKNDSVESRYKKNRIIEFDSRTAAVVFAYQASLPAPGERPGDYRPPDFLSTLEEMNPHLAREAKKHRHLAEKGDWQGFAGQVFVAASKEFMTNGSYDQRLLQQVHAELQDMIKRPGGQISPPDIVVPDGVLTAKAQSNDELARSILLMGKPYVDPQTLDGPDFTQLMPHRGATKAYRQVRDLSALLEKEGIQLDTHLEEPDISLYAKHASEIVFDYIATPIAAAVINAPPTKIGRLGIALGSVALLTALAVGIDPDLQKTFRALQPKTMDRLSTNLQADVADEVKDYNNPGFDFSVRNFLGLNQVGEDIGRVATDDLQMRLIAKPEDVPALQKARTALEDIRDTQSLLTEQSDVIVSEIEANSAVIEKLSSTPKAVSPVVKTRLSAGAR